MAKLIINTDGGSRGNPGPAAAGILIRLDSKKLFSGGKYLGEATNNIAEYKALILAINWVLEHKKKIVFDEIQFLLDSELIVKQMTGDYKVKDEKMKELFSIATSKLSKLETPFNFKHVKREKNTVADGLVNAILDNPRV